MVNFCIISLVAGLYLHAFDDSNIRFQTKPAIIQDSYKWTLESQPFQNADRICNVQFKTCVAVAQGRTPRSFELLVLEKPNILNQNQFWLYNATSETVVLKGTRFYWRLEHDQEDWEPVELFAATVYTADKFKMVDC